MLVALRFIASLLAAAAVIQSTPAMAAGEPPSAGLPRHEPRLGRVRPVIAVVAFNPATEVTDYVVPCAVLAASGAADVIALGTDAGPIRMRPALRFRPQATLGDFDARYPAGADYVIVPNVYEGENDPLLLEWLRAQARKGATIVGICDGVPTLANAGLLDGRRATTHWYTIDRLERRHRGTQWIRNQRYIADGNVITTSGVSASLPIAMALVEAIAGRRHAEALGARLGIAEWTPAHDSERFKLTPARFLTALWNRTALWRHEDVAVAVEAGADEIRVALIADAYGRTRRSNAVSVAQSDAPVSMKHGLVLLPDRVDAPATRFRGSRLPAFDELPPAQALDRSLADIGHRYGERTADFVALTMEYAWRR